LALRENPRQALRGRFNASMKTKVAAFVLLFVALSVLSLYYVLMYRQVVAQDAEEGQLLNQVKISKIEYNSSDLTIINGTPSGNFSCNITYNNPANSTCHLGIMELGYYLNQRPAFQTTSCYYYPDLIVLNSGDSVITKVLYSNSYYDNISTTDGTPIFYLTT
jgi:hypothetical protein